MSEHDGGVPGPQQLVGTVPAPAPQPSSEPEPVRGAEPGPEPGPESGTEPGPPASAWQAGLAAAAARRPSPLVAVLVVLALVVVSGAVAGGTAVWRAREHGTRAGSGPASTASPGGGTDATADVTDLTALMDRRAKAILGHDRTAFLADVDTRDPTFLAEQRRLYDNLQLLPLSSWTYRVLPDGQFHRPDLAARYGAPAAPQAVVLTYGIKGFDRGVVARGLIYTFVRRGGAWKLGGDSDLDGLLPPGGHAEPWDVQPIAVVRGSSSIVIGARADQARMKADAKRVDQAITKVAAMWKSGWSRKVVVITSSDQAVIRTYFRGDDLAQLSDVAAIHVPTFGNLFNWYGSGFPTSGPTGDRIIINPKAEIAPDDLPFVLTHEVTHQATRPLQGAAPPTWLVEGTAEYTAYREYELHGVDLPSALRADLKDGIDYLPTNTGFYSQDPDRNYVESWLACAYIADHWSEATLRRLYAVLGANDDGTAVSDAEDAAFRSVLKTSRPAFLTGLTAYVKKVSA